MISSSLASSSGCFSTASVAQAASITRFEPTVAAQDTALVLNGSGTSLVGAKPVVPPFNFNVYLTLLQGEGDEAKAVENYTVPFKG